MNNIIYVVEHLPADIALEKDLDISYRVCEYTVERETKDYVWLTKVDSRILPERKMSTKWYKPHKFTYGRFTSEAEAWQKIAAVLNNKTKSMYDSYVRANTELNEVYKIMNSKGIAVKIRSEAHEPTGVSE